MMVYALFVYAAIAIGFVGVFAFLDRMTTDKPQDRYVLFWAFLWPVALLVAIRFVMNLRHGGKP